MGLRIIIAKKMTFWMIGHSVLFTLVEKHTTLKCRKYTLLVFWIIAHVAIYGWQTVAITATAGIFVLIITKIYPKKIATWTVIIIIFMLTSERILILNDQQSDLLDYTNIALFA